jgi:hypothetical protein
MVLLPRGTENESLHRLGKPFVIVGSSESHSLRIEIIGGVGYSNGKT